MTKTINSTKVRQLLLHAATRIEAAEAQLNEYDSAIGDGDHGITMRLGFQAVCNRLAELPEGASVGQLLSEAGRAFMGNTGGAIGVILGRAFMNAGKDLGDVRELGSVEVKHIFRSMEATVTQTGKAKPGDKTLLDPLHAVNEALAMSTAEPPDLLDVASCAADKAARDTAGMLCRLGRASRLGDRVLGHPDPGAMSFALIVAAFAEEARAQMVRVTRG